MTNVIKCTSTVKYLYPDVSNIWRLSLSRRQNFWDASKSGWNFYPFEIPAEPTPFYPTVQNSLYLIRICLISGHVDKETLQRVQKGDPSVPTRFLWTGITFNMRPAGGDIQKQAHYHEINKGEL